MTIYLVATVVVSKQATGDTTRVWVLILKQRLASLALAWILKLTSVAFPPGFTFFSLSRRLDCGTADPSVENEGLGVTVSYLRKLDFSGFLLKTCCGRSTPPLGRFTWLSPRAADWKPGARGALTCACAFDLLVSARTWTDVCIEIDTWLHQSLWISVMNKNEWCLLHTWQSVNKPHMWFPLKSTNLLTSWPPASPADFLWLFLLLSLCFHLFSSQSWIHQHFEGQSKQTELI